MNRNVARHYHVDAETVFREQARKIDRLVRGDGPVLRHDVLCRVHFLIVIVILLLIAFRPPMREQNQIKIEGLSKLGGLARHCRICSASMIAMRRKSSWMLVLMMR